MSSRFCTACLFMCFKVTSSIQPTKKYAIEHIVPVTELTNFHIFHFLGRMLKLQVVTKVEYSELSATALTNGAHYLTVELSRVPNPGLTAGALQLGQAFTFQLLLQLALPLVV